MPRPRNDERPPDSLVEFSEAGDTAWVELWTDTLAVLKRQETWDPATQRKWLEEYVHANRLMVYHREEAERDGNSSNKDGRVFAHPGFALADAAERRVERLADLLILTPKARKAHGIYDEEGSGDPFDDLDEEDELAKRRSRRPA